MAQLTLTAASPAQAFTEPLTVAILEEYLHLPTLSPIDEGRDDLLESLIIAARETAELYQGRDLVEKQWDLTLPYFLYVIELRAPLVSVDLVQYTDSDGNVTALAETTDYIVDTVKHPGIIMPPYGEIWPSFTPYPTSAVLIRFTSGYAASDIFWSDAGQRVLTGMKMLIAHWYNNRNVIFAQGGSSSMELPFAITALLSSGALPRAY